MRSSEGPMLSQEAKTLKDFRLGESSYTNPSLFPTSAVLRKTVSSIGFPIPRI